MIAGCSAVHVREYEKFLMDELLGQECSRDLRVPFLPEAGQIYGGGSGLIVGVPESRMPAIRVGRGDQGCYRPASR